MLITVAPAKNITQVSGCAVLILPALNSRKPTTKLNSPHIALIGAEDRPTPGGFAKGDGNLLPDTPWTKCGKALARKAPAKKHAK